jgi:hypothetical protein
VSHLDKLALEHLRNHGWVRVQAAFRAEDAARMCDVIWDALENTGIRRNDSATWTIARPEHLQHLKGNPVFRAVGTERTIGAIDDTFEGQPWERASDWGAFFLQFPGGGEWNVPSAGWHVDGNYGGRLRPPCGVKVHAMLTDVQPRCGGVNILSGSHRLIHKWFSENPPLPGAKAAQLRKSLGQHPYLRDLCAGGAAAARIARFHERVEEVDGIPLQAIEITASAGDVILMHTLVLHAGAPAAHLGTEPRFLLNKDFVQPYW